MQTLQKLAVPIAIVLAGAMIAVSLYMIKSRPVTAGTPMTATQEVRGVQKDDHVLGNPNAQVVIIEYSDPECPFCKQFHESMHQIISDHGASGKVAWVYRHFPIQSLHPKGPKEAEALECAAEQGGNDMFWKFADKIYRTTASNNSLDIGVYNTPATPLLSADGKPAYAQKAPRSASDAGQLTDFAQELGLSTTIFEECLKSGKYADRVSKDANEAIQSGAEGTPFSIMLFNGEQVPVPGAQPYANLKQLIESIL